MRLNWKEQGRGGPGSSEKMKERKGWEGREGGGRGTGIREEEGERG